MTEYHLSLLIFQQRVKDLCAASAECARLAPPPVPDAQDDPLAAEVVRDAVAMLHAEGVLRPGFAQLLQGAVFTPPVETPPAAVQKGD